VQQKPVVLFTGAHLIKNGLARLIVELVKKGMFTLVAGNTATAIHDFELALIGETSEHVPNALGRGQFGMAYEFAYINSAIRVGFEKGLGLGETLGRMMTDVPFKNSIVDPLAHEDSPRDFCCTEVSIAAACYNYHIPFTVHCGIGVDVIDQHPSFNGAAKGCCSARDFLIFTNEITRFQQGGVFINVGSAVQGPEVLLKAVSMAANSGKAPREIICADFDLRVYSPEKMADECSPGYYFRDQKTVVTRVPTAFGGRGYYICGNQKLTIPLLYQKISQLYADELECS
ncbi:MAG: hypothetical protein SCK70_08965, partial [bacterium]|nr:hypothetical protein [bacterium]